MTNNPTFYKTNYKNNRNILNNPYKTPQKMRHRRFVSEENAQYILSNGRLNKAVVIKRMQHSRNKANENKLYPIKSKEDTEEEEPFKAFPQSEKKQFSKMFNNNALKNCFLKEINKKIINKEKEPKKHKLNQYTIIGFKFQKFEEEETEEKKVEKKKKKRVITISNDDNKLSGKCDMMIQTDE